MKDRDRALRDELLRRLEPLPVTARAMFGGAGLWLEDRYFGLISNGVAYFRTDANSRDEYVSRGMTAFHPPGRPRGPKAVGRNFRLPDDVFEDAETLRAWALRAAAAER